MERRNQLNEGVKWMPKENHVKEIGEFYNKVQEANNQIQDARSTQQQLNNIAANADRQSAEGNISKVHAMLQAASLLFSLMPPQQNKMHEPSLGSSNAVRQKRNEPSMSSFGSNNAPNPSPERQTAPVRKKKRTKQQTTPTPRQFAELQNEATTISKSRTTTILPQTTNGSGLEQVEQINEDIINNQIPAARYTEPLPVFYYDYELFQKRNKTSDVNKEMKAFFIKEGLATPSTPESKLAEIAEGWIESLSLSEANISGKAGFLTYQLLQAYGVENVRLGDFISTVKLQNILMQWKVNAALEGYKYTDIAEEKNPQILSFPEHVSMLEFEKYKKESEQIFYDFIHDLNPRIPKDQPIDLLFYKHDLWEARGKTEQANKAVETFLKDHGSSLNEPPPRELVRKMREWILAGETYSEIKSRETRAAESICLAYGIQKAPETVSDARLYLLQWENNNAQSGYIYNKPKNLDKIEVGEKEKNQDFKQKITDFLQENDFGQARNGTEKSILPKLDSAQKESQQKAVAAFLAEKGIAKDVSESRQLAETIASWITSELKASGTTNPANMKQLANLLIGKKEEEAISVETAGEIVTAWVMGLNENSDSSLTTQDFGEKMQGDMPSEQLSSPLAAKGRMWRDQKVMKAVARLFQQEGHLSSGAPDNEVIAALGKWFLQEDGHAVLSPDKTQTLAKVILKEMKLYGGAPEEKISMKDAEKTVMKWTFENVLHSSIEEHLVKEVLASSDPSRLKISALREGLERIANAYLPVNPHDHEYAFKTIWTTFLEKALPNYLYQTEDLAKDSFVSDYAMLTQLTGEKLLASEESRKSFSQAEVRTLGAYFLNTTIGKEKASPEELQQLLLPALLATAQLEPELLREGLEKGNYQEVVLNTFTSYWRKGYFKVIETQETLQPLLAAYQRATLDWRRKGKLAGDVIKECHKRGVPMEVLMFPRVIPGLNNLPIGMLVGQDAYDTYLKGLHPCPTISWTPPNLEEWYTSLTKAAADAYLPLDKKLIELAFESMDPKEYEFFSSSETQIYKASAKLKLKKPETRPPIHARHRVDYGGPFPKTVWNLEETDLFVAKCGGEERIYALKKLGNEAGYKLYSVDRRLAAYLKYELFSVEESVKVVRPLDSRDFDLSIDVDQTSRSHSDKQYYRQLASEIGLRNREKLYNQLYESGNDQSVAEQTFDMLKHIIPFYDCVTESRNGHAAEAVPACLMDIVSLIPVAGQAVGLSTKFGLGVSKALLRGGLRNALKNSGYFLPKSTELTKLGISTLQYLDPGVELLADGGRLAVKGLTKLKEHASTAEKAVLEKLETLEETTSVVESFKRAQLPENGPEVPVKRIKDHLYVQINEKTGDGFGRYFVLKGNQLEVFKEVPAFTKNQQNLIEHLAIKNEQFQHSEDIMNSYPAAYGEGMIRKTVKEGASPQLFIKMKNRWVPVRETAIQGKQLNVRYDVCMGKRVFPVNYNGAEWYFEPRTSPFAAKRIAGKIRKEINDFEFLNDPSTLSAPDERGLMRDASGKPYIKINDRYMPLVLLDKEAERYQLLRKNRQKPTIVLRFDLENRRFRLETPREKKTLEAEKNRQGEKNLQRGKEGCETDMPPLESMILCGGATSRPRQSGLENNIPRKSVRKKVSGNIAYNTLPESPKKGAEWNAIRKPIINKQERVRIEDDKVSLPPRTEFIPEEPIVLLTKEKKVRELILKGIKNYAFDLSRSNYEFQVFAGLNPNGMPEFIKPFQEEVASGLAEAEGIFRGAKYKFKRLLEQSNIAATDEGRYLTEMFSLEDAPNKEEILKEIAKRLLSMSEKGEQFLQKTAEFDFKNILIVSTKLELDPKTNSYQSTMKEKARAKAFVIPSDPECRIMISADAFRQNPEIAPDLQLNKRVSETLTHEVTHVVSGTKDIVFYTIPERGFRKNGADVRSGYEHGLANLRESRSFQDFVDQLAATDQSLEKLSAGMVFYLLSYDHMLYANLQITDATMVSIIMRDIAEGRAFNEEIRMKRSVHTNHQSELGADFMSLALASMNNFHFITQQEKVKEKTQKNEGPAADVPVSIRTEERTGEQRVERSLLNIVERGKENSRRIEKQRADSHAVKKQERAALQF
jgi:hypothetical protein